MSNQFEAKFSTSSFNRKLNLIKILKKKSSQTRPNTSKLIHHL